MALLGPTLPQPSTKFFSCPLLISIRSLTFSLGLLSSLLMKLNEVTLQKRLGAL